MSEPIKEEDDSKESFDEEISKIFVLQSLPDWASEHDPKMESSSTEMANPNLVSTKLTTSSQKTATTSLKEYCDKKKLNPKFDLISSAAGRFVYEAKLNDLVFNAEAANKKIARNKCSEKMLLALKDNMSDEDRIRYLKPFFSEEQIGEIKSEVAEKIGHENPIGDLQEYATALQWPKPMYEVIDETGPAHVKTFIMKCTMNKITALGTAKSKKLAKREAAVNMLAKLGQMKLADESVKSKADTVKESLAQLEDNFLPETSRKREDPSSQQNPDGDKKEILEWRSEEKKAKLEEKIEMRNNLDLSIKPYQNTYKDDLTPINFDKVMSNIESQLPNVNYSHELEKYLNMNGIKHEYRIHVLTVQKGSLSEVSNVANDSHCALTINFALPMTFLNSGFDADEAKHAVAREALIHLINKSGYKELSMAQLSRMIPPRVSVKSEPGLTNPSSQLHA